MRNQCHGRRKSLTRQLTSRQLKRIELHMKVRTAVHYCLEPLFVSNPKLSRQSHRFRTLANVHYAYENLNPKYDNKPSPVTVLLVLPLSTFYFCNLGRDSQSDSVDTLHQCIWQDYYY